MSLGLATSIQSGVDVDIDVDIDVVGRAEIMADRR